MIRGFFLWHKITGEGSEVWLKGFLTGENLAHCIMINTFRSSLQSSPENNTLVCYVFYISIATVKEKYQIIS